MGLYREVYQTKRVKRDGYGNCLAACISSLTGLDIDDFPDLPQDCTWLDFLSDILKVKGYSLEFDVDPPNSKYYIEVIKPEWSKRTHAVISKNGKIVFNPSRGGKVDYKYKTCYYLELKK